VEGTLPSGFKSWSGISLGILFSCDVHTALHHVVNQCQFKISGYQLQRLTLEWHFIRDSICKAVVQWLGKDKIQLLSISFSQSHVVDHHAETGRTVIFVNELILWTLSVCIVPNIFVYIVYCYDIWVGISCSCVNVICICNITCV
jgi:hypothetical protein